MFYFKFALLQMKLAVLHKFAVNFYRLSALHKNCPDLHLKFAVNYLKFTAFHFKLSERNRKPNQKVEP